MALTAEQVYALAKGYTDKAIEGGGSTKGKNCTIDSITDITGGHRVTFKWYLDDGTEETDIMDVMDGQDGANGQDGKDGKDGADGQPGADGKDGKDGKNGTNGVSPTVIITDITGGHEVSITDATGIHHFNVMDGVPGSPGPSGIDGQDGFSPVVTVNTIAGGHEVDIEDATGIHVFNVMDGQQGQQGDPGYRTRFYVIVPTNYLSPVPTISSVTLAISGTSITLTNVSRSDWDDVHPNTNSLLTTSALFYTDLDEPWLLNRGSGFNLVKINITYTDSQSTVHIDNIDLTSEQITVTAPMVEVELEWDGTGFNLSNIHQFYNGVIPFDDLKDRPTKEVTSISNIVSPLPTAPMRYHKYSTEEQVVGEWIDGKPIYEKTISCGSLPGVADEMRVAHSIANIDKVLNYTALGLVRDSGAGIMINGSHINNPATMAIDTDTIISCFVSRTNVVFRTNGNRGGWDGYVTIQYTKTTD